VLLPDHLATTGKANATGPPHSRAAAPWHTYTPRCRRTSAAVLQVRYLPYMSPSEYEAVLARHHQDSYTTPCTRGCGLLAEVHRLRTARAANAATGAAASLSTFSQATPAS